MSLRLACWNVLADAYVRREYYPHTPEALLAPGARQARVLDHLAAVDADVICLQEVEAPLFAAAAQRLGGHAGRFAGKGGGKPDGCALFVRAPLRLAGVRELRYADGSGHLALLGELDAPWGRLVVATTHLKWDAPGTPAAGRFGLGQAAALVVAAPDVVCGDFNVTPDDDVIACFRAAGYRDAFAGPGGFTCNANQRARRIDFVLHAPALAAEGQPPPAIDGDTPLPSPEHPSDHVPLVVRLSLAATG